jgi:type VI protein secretion system component VasK
MAALTNLDVVQILQVGIAGLCFLLALLVYSLLRKALTLPSPSEHIIKLIKSFMVLTGVFVVLVFATTILNTFISQERIEKLKEKEVTLTNVSESQKNEINELKRRNLELQQTVEEMKRAASAPAQKSTFPIKDAWVKLYEDDNFRGREVIVKYPHDIANFGSMATP